MQHLYIHPLCSLVPPMRQDDMDELRKSIRDNGYDRMYPITRHEGMILDGRSRYQVCIELGVEPYIVDWEPIGPNDTPRAFVRRHAMARRHFTASERAACAVNFIEDSVQSGMSRAEATREAAADLKVSPTLIQEARRIKERAPDVFDEVSRGELTVGAATRKVTKQEAASSTPMMPTLKRDGAGNIVKDKQVKDALNQVDRFDHLVTLLGTVKKEMNVLAGEPVGRALRADQIELELKNAIEAIKFAIPFAACPYTTCTTSGCKACGGTRWVTKNVWVNIPSEIREAR